MLQFFILGIVNFIGLDFFELFLVDIVIIVGIIGYLVIIDVFIVLGVVDVFEMEGKWEVFISQVVENFILGIVKVLVIVGVDFCGIIYGIYDVSE